MAENQKAPSGALEGALGGPSRSVVDGQPVRSRRTEARSGSTEPPRRDDEDDDDLERRNITIRII